MDFTPLLQLGISRILRYALNLALEKWTQTWVKFVMGTFSHIHVAFLILRPVAIIRHSITFSVVTIVFMYLYSTHCFLYISDSTDEESLFDNQEFVKLMIISFILMTFEIDSRVMLLGEIRSQSLLRFHEP